MRKGTGIIIICFSLALISCRKNEKKEDARKIVTEWVGKEILFPDGIPCQFFGKDTTCLNVNSQRYKIMSYTDSAGCTSCRLKLTDWKRLIAEADSLFPGKIDFLFFFQPKTRDLKELAFMFKRDNFEYPVFIDRDNRIDRLNGFPSGMEYQCFLLDQTNKVVSVGNPTLNPRIWDLYKQQISGEKETRAENQTVVQAVNAQVKMDDMQVGKDYVCVFEIENTGSFPYLMLDIKSSCGCTVPVWSKQPVVPGGKTAIKVGVKPEATGFFNKTIQVYGNAINSPLKLSIIGLVK